MSKQIELPVQEVFHSFQGEGVHIGRSAFFIRTFGCPVQCPWCDSAGTWHKDYTPKPVPKQTVESLVQQASQANPEFVVITGGEPTIHNLEPVTKALKEAGHQIHLETCGAFTLQGNPIFDWITLSPKREAPPLNEMLFKANELKIIVDTVGAIAEWEEKIGDKILKKLADNCNVAESLRSERRGWVFPVQFWLNIEWSQKENEVLRDMITQAVKHGKFPYRAGWQMHKLFKADQIDSRSAEAVPLGGDPTKGF